MGVTLEVVVLDEPLSNIRIGPAAPHGILSVGVVVPDEMVNRRIRRNTMPTRTGLA